MNIEADWDAERVLAWLQSDARNPSETPEANPATAGPEAAAKWIDAVQRAVDKTEAERAVGPDPHPGPAPPHRASPERRTKRRCGAGQSPAR